MSNKPLDCAPRPGDSTLLLNENPFTNGSCFKASKISQKSVPTMANHDRQNLSLQWICYTAGAIQPADESRQ
jgi:hypothetical protein